MHAGESESRPVGAILSESFSLYADHFGGYTLVTIVLLVLPQLVSTFLQELTAPSMEVLQELLAWLSGKQYDPKPLYQTLALSAFLTWVSSAVTYLLLSAQSVAYLRQEPHPLRWVLSRLRQTHHALIVTAVFMLTLIAVGAIVGYWLRWALSRLRQTHHALIVAAVFMLTLIAVGTVVGYWLRPHAVEAFEAVDSLRFSLTVTAGMGIVGLVLIALVLYLTPAFVLLAASDCGAFTAMRDSIRLVRRDSKRWRRLWGAIALGHLVGMLVCCIGLLAAVPWTFAVLALETATQQKNEGQSPIFAER